MVDEPIRTQHSADEEYDRALRRAFWRDLFWRLGRRCNDLVPAAELLEQVSEIRQHDLGLQQVPLERITSSGRSQDFDLIFYPKRRDASGRWQSIVQATLSGRPLPRLQLLKIGGAHLVLDGNHRLSVARVLGQKVIEANVIEIEAENLEPRTECSRLGFKLRSKTSC